MLKIKSILHERINESRKIAPVSEFQWWKVVVKSQLWWSLLQNMSINIMSKLFWLGAI